MFLNIHRLSMFTVTAAVMLFSVNSAQAQCSRGSSGGSGPTLSVASTGLINPQPAFSSSANSRAIQQQLAYQRQAGLRRQQFAMRQQLAQSQYAQQQDLHTMRFARAEAKRAKRSARIAALRARYSEDGDRAVMLASTVSSTNPFQ